MRAARTQLIRLQRNAAPFHHVRALLVRGHARKVPKRLRNSFGVCLCRTKRCRVIETRQDAAPDDRRLQVRAHTEGELLDPRIRAKIIQPALIGGSRRRPDIPTYLCQPLGLGERQVAGDALE